MSRYEFEFSSARKIFFAELLSRCKPRLDEDRIVYFLNECEKEIGQCFSPYPNGFDADNDAATALKNVADCAYALNSALCRLSGINRFALSSRILEGNERGLNAKKITDHATFLGDLLQRIDTEAHELKGGCSSSMSARISEDLATSLAKAYCRAFKTTPSLRRDSIYKQFVDEITENDLPGRFKIQIGMKPMRLANERINVFCNGY